MTKSIAEDSQRAEQVAEILKAMAHPLRVRIIAVLVEGPQHVNALAEILGAKQAVVSQQLRILRMRGLVSAIRESGFAYYRVAEPNLQQMISCMEGCSTH